MVFFRVAGIYISGLTSFGICDFAVCSFGDGGTAGVGKTEDFRHLIKAFADGVVASGADDVKVVVLVHFDNLGMAAGDNEG